MIDEAAKLQRKARGRRIVGFSAMAAIGLLFAAVIAHAFTAEAEQRRAEHWRVHTLEVLIELGRAETAANTALRGGRGYLLTGDANFLQAYDRGRRDSVSEVQRLRELTADNPVQQRNFAAVQAQLDDYLAVLGIEVALQASGRHAAAVAMVRGGSDLSRIDRLARGLETARAEELRLLAARSLETARADRRAEAQDWFIASLGAAMMVLLASALFGAGRAHRRSLDLTAALGRLAATDALTGLANRRQVMQAIESEVRRARRTGRALSLALLDIDHFKRVNDTHGHPGGDAVLRGVAEVLREVTRGGDLLGRFGGEEFAVLMPETDTAQAEIACERLRAAIEGREFVLPGGGTGKVTVSTGVARLSRGEPEDQLISRADTALYAAKAGGRNQVRLAA